MDDCLFFGSTNKEIQNKIQLLKDPKPEPFALSEESDVAGFLGLIMEKTKDRIGLKQVGLIDRILVSLGLEDRVPKSTPNEKTPLGKDAKVQIAWKTGTTDQ